MHARRGRVLPFASWAWLLVMPLASAVAGPEDSKPLLIKPSAERTIDFKAGMADLFAYMPLEDDEMAVLARLAITSDGKSLFVQDVGGRVVQWDVATGKPLHRCASARVKCFALSPDGKSLVTVVRSVNYQGGDSVELWDLAKRKVVRRLDEGANRMTFTAVTFSPDGKTLALGAAVAQYVFGIKEDIVPPGGGKEEAPPGENRKQKDYAIHLWDIASGDELRQLDGPTRTAKPDEGTAYYPQPNGLYDNLRYSPDGRSLALVVENRVLLWETATGKERSALDGLRLPPRKRSEMYWGESPHRFCLSYTPDGRTMAVGGPDGVIRQWDLTSGRELPPLVGHKGAIRAVTFSQDGKTLWSIGWDTKFYTWPAGTARDWKPRKDKLTDQQLEALWKDLTADDAVLQHAAVQTLAAAPDQTVPFLTKQLKPVRAADANLITQLVDTLSKHGDYNVRKKAAVQLRKLGEPALSYLQRPGDEILRNIVEMIEDDLFASPEHQQRLVAIQVLELAGSEAAEKLLGELAGGAEEAQLTKEAKAAKERLTKALSTSKKLDDLWTDLAGEDSRKATRAIRAMSANADKAVPFLKEHLVKLAAREEFEDDPRRIAKLIDDLDSNNFKTRENATKELGRLGPLATPALGQALEKATSAEAKKRLEDLLKAAAQSAPLTEKLRAGRAFEALEHIGSAEAKKVLAALAQDAKNASLRESAADSLRRIGQ